MTYTSRAGVRSEGKSDGGRAKRGENESAGGPAAIGRTSLRLEKEN